ncbi:hypothetical protein RQM59_02800 [Flavobacteriaceae bacterium S356]|uniref:Uncharacterized protein n=1 Tax=Asprobacillus argus TaxID=3076534 RepID=A0ABU3LC34_9FLAO|nr:hypothetical protein [Flavobacteriaceae bacterium S356]
MKKIAPILFAVFVLLSCEDNQTTINISTPYTLDESFEVGIPQTGSGQTNFNETSSHDLSQLIANYSDINSVTVNSLTYQFANFSGDTAGVIQTAILTINNVTVATISNVNISQEAANNTIFQITDAAVISQIQNILETTSIVNLQASGTVNSSIPMNFTIDVHLDIEAN